MSTAQRKSSLRLVPVDSTQQRPFERVNLRDQVGQSLRWSLFSGELLPGETFSVPTLAQQFGVSATPVREAVLDLVQQGLVVVMPNKGFRVAYTSPKEMLENVEIRKLIELPVTLEVAQVISSEQLDVLREMAESIFDYATEGDVRGFVSVDYEFHRYLLNVKGNSTLTDLVEDLRSRARIQSVPIIALSGRMVETAQEHIDLIDALERKDHVDIERITLLHMSHALDGLPGQGPINTGTSPE
jgi:DNA-binding GntR family transcriptional regulator